MDDRNFCARIGLGGRGGLRGMFYLERKETEGMNKMGVFSGNEWATRTRELICVFFGLWFMIDCGIHGWDL